VAPLLIKSKSSLSLEDEQLGSYLKKSSGLVVTWSFATLLHSLKISYLPIDLKRDFLLNYQLEREQCKVNFLLE